MLGAVLNDCIMFLLFVSTLGSDNLVPKTYPCYILRVYLNQKNLCLLTKKPDSMDIHTVSQCLYILKPTNSLGTRETLFALMLLSTVCYLKEGFAIHGSQDQDKPE